MRPGALPPSRPHSSVSHLSSGGSMFTVLGKCHRIPDPRVPGPKAWLLPLPHDAPFVLPSPASSSVQRALHCTPLLGCA